MIRKILFISIATLMIGSLQAQKNLKLFHKRNTNKNITKFEPIVCPAGHDHSDHYVPPATKSRSNSTSTISAAEIGMLYDSNVPDPVKTIFEDFLSPQFAETYTSNIPINIRVHWGGTDALAAATPTTYARRIPSLPLQDTWYPAPMAEKILNRQINHPDSADIEVWINDDIDWYFAWFRPENVQSRFDLASILYHEVLHGMGFLSLRGYSAESGEV